MCTRDSNYYSQNGKENWYTIELGWFSFQPQINDATNIYNTSLFKFLINPNSQVILAIFLDAHAQVAEGARLNRASKIIGVDINPEKFEIGRLISNVSSMIEKI